MAFEIVPTEFAAGAEICGVHLAEPLGDNLLATLDRVLGEYGVIFSRNQDLFARTADSGDTSLR